ncbi:hypothetical protein MKW94_009711 [Papaver nudicaule]|uniref:Exostosin GT47 domain-containing protein n=1 Tax=Papaver nudicaule TaxID=74823 RepID=A0AA41VJS2_PAPNU|nr:hypothetical protein [Papaver nudicaule]
MADLPSYKTPLIVFTSLLLLVILYLSPYNNHNFVINTDFVSSNTSSSSQNPQNFSADSSSSTTHEDKGTLSISSSSTSVNTHIREKLTSSERIEDDLARARAAIREAAQTRNYTSNKMQDYIPRGPAYRNPYAFHQSYIEMEKTFKIWSYKEGDLPLMHDGPHSYLYSIEGHFIDEMENEKNPFAAQNMDDAHAFFLPFSVTNMVSALYKAPSGTRVPYIHVVTDYVRVISNKYQYWNRSGGGDHFMASCHDWAAAVTSETPNQLFKNVIRVLCNANSSESFQPKRDVSLPEISLVTRTLVTSTQSRRESGSNHSILGFFAGGAHGPIRQMLIEHWKDKDDALQVHEYLPKGTDYGALMSKTKFCLCPSGYEVASPRVVEAIHASCVPVIISDHYVLPFSDVLDWSQFSVQIPMEKIPELKSILLAISDEKYLKLQKRVRQVQQHFTLNRPPKRFDVIHMILHSVWLRRLNFRLPA